ncbi:MAG: D-alanine--D-alanine ligase [Erysipelotrichaceae bacterium]|jgi:D-alanine-D-alanine ligase|nr:D-alanine--D-alanine ligase [Erysipelotrichaceae bacterium]
MKLKVGVAFGGQSVEHEISILSAMQVMHALDDEKYEIVPMYFSKEKNLFCDDSLRDLNTFKNLDVLEKKFLGYHLMRDQQHFYLEPNTRRLFSKRREIDIVIPVMHGTGGEDGVLQGYLEMIGIPYCGCRVLGAAVGQDKVMMKEILQNRGLPVVEWMYVTCYDELDDRFLEKVNTLGYPLIVKPSGLGSSIAIQKVMDEDELRHALSEAFRYDEKVILERAVQNLKEINASVMGDLSSSEVSVLEEVVKADDILSYHDKYEGAKTKGMAGAAREIPARISVEQTIQIEELAKKTFRELHAKGIARIDFMMDEDTQTIYVNEINTIPGSLSFYLWEPKQLSFTKLLDELIDLGLRNYRRQQQRITSYSTNILQTFDPKNGNKLK